MVRIREPVRQSGKVVLIVDDNREFLQATRSLIEREGHTVLCADNGVKALEILQQEHVDLLLLDYFMPGMTGEEVVDRLRAFNPYVQVILQTGYASEHPPRELMRRLDIQGYFDKGDGPEKLLLWVDVGLKASTAIQLIAKSQQGLRYILDVTPDLHRIKSVHDLLEGIVYQVTGLLAVMDSFLALLPEGRRLQNDDPTAGFVAMSESNAGWSIHAGTGRFYRNMPVEACLDDKELASLQKALSGGKVLVQGGATIVPLCVGELTFGVLYLDRWLIKDADLELVQIFANQAAVAIHNVKLYEMATIDPLTGVLSRGVFDQLIQREVRTAFRSQDTLVLLMLDLDGFKRLNDNLGHLAGDRVLAQFGRLLRDATRASDHVARYGGDEFAVILPSTTAEDAGIVVNRMIALTEGLSEGEAEAPFKVSCSIGKGVLAAHDFPDGDVTRPVPQDYFQAVSLALMQCADSALLAAKADRKGGYSTATVRWMAMSDAG